MRDQPRQTNGNPVVPAHARQSAQLCQGPLLDGQRNPQRPPAAETQRALHADRRAQDPRHGEGLRRPFHRHR